MLKGVHSILDSVLAYDKQKPEILHKEESIFNLEETSKGSYRADARWSSWELKLFILLKQLWKIWK